ncbi:MAG: flagellar hook-length control protein FliK [Methylobacter sp.]
MNIEAMNLLSPVPSGVTSEAGAPVVTVDGTATVAGAFSGTLMTQIELLNNLKTGAALPPTAPGISVSQTVSGEQSEETVGQNAPVLENVTGTGKNISNLQALVAGQNIDGSKEVVSVPVNNAHVQEIAVPVGNDLPPSYKTRDDVDHEAALAAVNDSLKYISAGVSPEDKVVQTAPPTINQNINNVSAMPKLVEQSTINAVANVTPPVQQAVQNKEANSTQGNDRNDIKDAVVIDVSVQKMPAQISGSFSQKQAEAKTKESVDDQSAAEKLLAAIMLTPVTPAPAPTQQITPAEQIKDVNNLASAPVVANVVKQEAPQLLSDVKVAAENINLTQSIANGPSPVSANSSQDMPINNPVNISQGETAFSLPVQAKQNSVVADVGISSQVEKSVQPDQQVVSMETGKVTLNANTGVVQVAQTDIENTAEVPAITKPLTHPEWGKDLGDRIVWMNNKSIPAAEIRLNPQHLGPISVRVNVSDDQASIVFTAQHAVVRETLEASIPKLREMMSAQNLNLADVNVAQSYTSDQGGRPQSQNSAQSFADAGGSNRPGGESAAMEEGEDMLEQEIDSGRATVSKGILSLYA